jgi:hypothetical protein
MTTKLNLIQKLIEVRKAVPYLKKDNKGFQFQFVSSSQTLAALKGAMDEQGVLLVPSVTAYEIRDHTTKKGFHEYFTHLTLLFRWIDADNPADTLESQWCGQGLDDAEKGIGKALTYAEKYFLLKFFNIPTDNDDPDSFQQKRGPASKPVAPPTPAQVAGELADSLMGALTGADNTRYLDSIWVDPNFIAALHKLPLDKQQAVEACYNTKKSQLTEVPA